MGQHGSWRRGREHPSPRKDLVSPHDIVMLRIASRDARVPRHGGNGHGHGRNHIHLEDAGDHRGFMQSLFRNHGGKSFSSLSLHGLSDLRGLYLQGTSKLSRARRGGGGVGAGSRIVRSQTFDSCWTRRPAPYDPDLSAGAEVPWLLTEALQRGGQGSFFVIGEDDDGNHTERCSALSQVGRLDWTSMTSAVALSLMSSDKSARVSMSASINAIED